MRGHFRKSILFAFLLLNAVCSAQELYFEKLTDKSGRSIGSTMGVLQGADDYLWIATSKGLFQYNGYGYKQYRHSSQNKQSIVSSTVSGLFQDSRGRLWLKHFDRFSVFQPEFRDSIITYIQSLDFDITANIKEDRWGNIWIGPHKKGILQLSVDNQLTWYNYAKPSYSKEQLQAVAARIKTSSIKIDAEAKGRDTILNFTVDSTGYYSICGFGEVYRNRLIDYCFVTNNADTVWQMDFSDVKYISQSSAGVIVAETLRLEQGLYTLHCVADDTDGPAANAYNLPLNGVYLSSIKQPELKQFDALFEKEYHLPKSIGKVNVATVGVNNTGVPFLLYPNAIALLDSSDWEFKLHRLPITDSLNVKKISHMLTVSDGKDGIWIGTDHGVVHYSFTSGDITTVNALNHGLKSKTIYSLCTDNNWLWIGTDKGIGRYNFLSGRIECLGLRDNASLWSNTIYSIDKDKSGNIWVSTSDGLNKLQRQNFSHTSLDIERYAKFPVVVLADTALLFHKKRNLLSVYSVQRKLFKTISLPDSIFPYDPEWEETDFSISSLSYYSHLIYVGISNKVFTYNLLTDEVTALHELKGVQYGKDSVKNRCIALHATDGGKIWAVGLNSVEQVNTGNYFAFGPHYEKGSRINFKYVGASFTDSKGKIWIRTQDSVLVFNSAQLGFELRFDLDNEGEYSSSKGNFSEDGIGDIWFADLPNIYQYHRGTKKIEKHTVDIAIDAGRVNVYAGKNATLWLYTDNGLLKIDKLRFSHEMLTIENGLADNNINGLIEDDYGKLWISTIKGLSIMQTYDNSCESFFLPADHQHFNFTGSNRAIVNDSLESLIFFTNKGFLIANANEINKRPPRVSIERLQVKGNSVDVDSIMREGGRLELPHNQNFLHVEFASLDYRSPEKNKYRFILEGLETEWQEKDANTRAAVYTNLEPGNYTFKVNASNNDYMWAEVPTQLYVTINPPWWHTWTAYIAYVVIGASSLFLYIRGRERKLQAEKMVLEQKVAERTREINQQKEEITLKRDEIAEQQKSIMDSIYYARRIQNAVLPPQELIERILPEHFILSKPRDIVSGDYYWAYSTHKQTIIAAADCTGHGVPGAFMSMLGVAFLNEIAASASEYSANDILNKLRDQVIKSLHQTGKIGETKDGMDIALCVLDHENKQLQFSGAYNPLYLVRKNELFQYKADRMPIGYHSTGNKPFSNTSIDLEKGDCFYIFSDGYADQFGGDKGKKFMAKRFKQLLLDVNPMPMEVQRDKLNEAIETWRAGYEQVDDILVVGIKV